MRGDTLFPLNELKLKWPEVYGNEVSKYKGREEILQAKVPILNCVWSDVLHFSAVAPQTIGETLRSSGMKNLAKVEWYKVPVSRIESLPTVELDTQAYMYKKEGRYDFSETHTRPLGSVERLQQLSPWVKKYYADEIAADRKPLFFNGLTHILVKGPLNISGLEIVSW